ncbi:FecR family protein [Mesorhizobium albiziae]|uniref:FecR family protein n=1 Tax=Neomesorhizobium albiziae TaxID=335020 RepID=A0A1I4AI38_9HYPH|nr:FecR domain-containing protein [Mesorhizobium albiziae]SFK55933.1 FecR family protein [Mesorhizobium albiziae]
MDARDWIVRLNSGSVSSEELDRFNAWQAQSPAHERAFAQERQFWRLLGGLEGSEAAAPLPASTVSRRRGPVSRRTFLAGGALVAGVAIAAPALVTWLRADFVTGSGEQANVDLPDGSAALLNTDSAIAVDFSAGSRRVDLLGGEVQFSVRPDAASPFRVLSLGGTSETAGAVFAVRSIDGEVTVTCAQGVASVTGGDADAASPVQVSAGRQTRYAKGRAPRPAAAIDLDVELAWQNGRLVFEGKPFGAAIRELGRYISERVVIANHSRDDVPVSAVFSMSGVYEAIEALAHTQGLAVRRVPGVAILIS